MKPSFAAAVLVVLLPALFLFPARAGGDSAAFTSADIARASVSAPCLDWKLRGICLKLRCGLFGCRIKTVPWVEHRIPDLVVSAYNEPGDNPWTEARALYGRPLAAAADAVARATLGVPLGGGRSAAGRPAAGRPGGAPGAAAPGRVSNLRFKEVTVVGNPAVAAFRRWLAGGTVPVACGTAVRPMALHFASEVDAAGWRTGIAEQLYPATWTPGARPIGRFPGGLWGTVHPRQGHVRQYHDVLAGAVAAQRAVDIATRSGQPHLYVPVPGIPESDETTDRWQMLHPANDHQCTTFGQEKNYFRGRENVAGPGEGGYGWLYWPLHHCCPGPGTTFFRFRF